MTPPPGYSHGLYQFEIGNLLKELLADGQTSTECPISTADGVRAADVAWISRERLKRIDAGSCLSETPEICVEVVSPGNSQAELEEKKALHFAAGASECWLCREGKMQFFGKDGAKLTASVLCPDMPGTVEVGLG